MIEERGPLVAVMKKKPEGWGMHGEECWSDQGWGRVERSKG